mgnify:CR=1 FL=1
MMWRRRGVRGEVPEFLRVRTVILPRRTLFAKLMNPSKVVIHALIVPKVGARDSVGEYSDGSEVDVTPRIGDGVVLLAIHLDA